MGNELALGGKTACVRSIQIAPRGEVHISRIGTFASCQTLMMIRLGRVVEGTDEVQQYVWMADVHTAEWEEWNRN